MIYKKKERLPIKQRAWELDFLRGLSILMVVWDHTMFDAAYIFGSSWRQSGVAWLENFRQFAVNYRHSDLRAFWWPVFVFIFFFVAGICTRFSRNNFIRAVKITLAALLVTLVTYILERFFAMGNVLILFGVLHCLAACMLLYSGIEYVVNLINKKKIKWVLPAVSAVITVLLFVFNSIYNAPFGSATLANSINTNTVFEGIFIYSTKFFPLTADYFPLLPFFAFFMLGATIAPLLYRKKQSLLPKLNGKWHYPFTLPGRYSLLIYLGLQVVVGGALALLTYIATGSL
ncbi:MAG: heparan-alpha-glucosaminide N-acetyltransferase domain-containing protein [Clostridia bacterium]